MSKIRKKRLDRTGEKYITNEGYEVEIIEYFNKNNCTILFNDNRIKTQIKFREIKKVKNPNHKTLYNIGFMGYGKYKAQINKKKLKSYSVWAGILYRCYSEIGSAKHHSYKGCSVDLQWHNFQNFAEWFESNYVEDWQLDKDILVKGNKIYSPKTCCFVPKEINLLFTKNKIRRGEYPIGVSLNGDKFQSTLHKGGKNYNLGLFNTPEEAFQAYKVVKESYIKEVADEWKDKINHKVYKAMYNYKVEITD